MNKHRELKPIVILLKKLLHVNKLNIPYFGTIQTDITQIGGISSFTLTLIVSAFLATSPPFPSVGHCFMNILEYFGKIFAAESMIVTQDCIAVTDFPDFLGEATLFVSDPFRPEINAASNVTRFPEIKKCFSDAYDKLIQKYEEWVGPGDENTSSVKQESVLRTIYYNST